MSALAERVGRSRHLHLRASFAAELLVAALDGNLFATAPRVIAVQLTSRHASLLARLALVGLLFARSPSEARRLSRAGRLVDHALFGKDASRLVGRAGLPALPPDRGHVLAVLTDRPTALPSRLPGLFGRELVRGPFLVRGAAAHPRHLSPSFFVHSGEPSSFSFTLRQRNLLLSLSLKTALTRMKVLGEGTFRVQQKMSHVAFCSSSATRWHPS